MAAALAFLLVLNFKKHKKYKYADLTKYLVLLVIINAELTITYEKKVHLDYLQNLVFVLRNID